MDNMDENEIGRLLRLKRFEQPPPAYFENFLHEFHRRQRDEMLRQPLWKIALERAHDFMFRLNVARLASYPVAAAAVIICAAVFSLKTYQTPHSNSVAQIAPTIPVAAASTASDWNLGTPVANVVADTPPRLHRSLSTHRAATPPRYVMDSMPVSYESTLRF